MEPKKLDNRNAQWTAATQLGKSNVYLMDSYTYDGAQPNVKTLRECPGVIRSIDYDALAIAWNRDTAAALAGAPSLSHYPLDVVNYLMSEKEWFESEEFKKAVEDQTPFAKPTDQVYLKPDAPGTSTDQNPKIGSPYETFGKVYEVVSNRNHTYTAYRIKFFNASGTVKIPQTSIITASEYRDKYLHKDNIFVLNTALGGIEPGTRFNLENDYYIAQSLDMFVIANEFTSQLFTKEN